MLNDKDLIYQMQQNMSGVVDSQLGSLYLHLEKNQKKKWYGLTATFQKAARITVRREKKNPTNKLTNQIKPNRQTKTKQIKTKQTYSKTGQQRRRGKHTETTILWFINIWIFTNHCMTQLQEKLTGNVTLCSYTACKKLIQTSGISKVEKNIIRKCIQVQCRG